MKEEIKCRRCGLQQSEWKGRWEKPICKVDETTYEQHILEITPMPHPLQDSEMREAWIREFGNPPLILDELTKGMSRCALCGINADAIADYWLKVLSSEKEKWIRGEIERLEGMKIKGGGNIKLDYANGKSYEVEAESDREIFYNQAIEDSLSHLTAQLEELMKI